MQKYTGGNAAGNDKNLGSGGAIPKDLQRYLNHYAGEDIDDPILDKNIRFYMNRIRSSPEGKPVALSIFSNPVLFFLRFVIFNPL